MESVPFTLSGVYADLAHVRGVARLDGDDLVLEFRMTDSLRGRVSIRAEGTANPTG